MKIVNPFEYKEVINDKTIHYNNFDIELNKYSDDMPNKKKWCLDYWYSNEGYISINDYLCRIKSKNPQTYHRIPQHFILYREKLKENDEKLANIVECIHSQMKPFQDNTDTYYYRGDNHFPKKNVRLETFFSITTHYNTARFFGDTVYKIIVDKDVKCIYLDTHESETLIENDCFYEIMKDTIHIHSPQSSLRYPYRYSLYKNDLFQTRKIFKLEKIIQYYCFVYFEKIIHKYINSVLFTSKYSLHNNYYIFLYSNFINKIIIYIEDLIHEKHIQITNEKDAAALHELSKDIFIKEKEIFKNKFNNEYIPRIKKIFSMYSNKTRRQRSTPSKKKLTPQIRKLFSRASTQRHTSPAHADTMK